MTSQPSMQAKPFQFTMRTMFIGVTLFAFLLGLGVWGVRYFQDLEQTKACAHSLFKQTALGICNYASYENALPSAYTVDTQGRRMQSWRVRVIPYYCSRFEEYRKDEPWDGPNNRKLHGHEYMQWGYRCPADQSEPRTATNIVAVVGPGTLWPGPTPCGSGRIGKAHLRRPYWSRSPTRAFTGWSLATSN